MAKPIPVDQGEMFEAGLMLLAWSPYNDYQKVKAGEADVQRRHKDTGARLWTVSVLDPTAEQGSFEVQIRVASNDRPPLDGINMFAQLRFEGLVITTYANDSGRSMRSYSAKRVSVVQAQGAGSAKAA